jgi:hypothetical protein
MEVAVKSPDGHKPDENWQRQRRQRSIAIALILIAMTALFYGATIVRLGSNALNRAM